MKKNKKIIKCSLICITDTCKIILTIILTFTLWATIPAYLGYKATTVVSESMEPKIKVSDVIIIKPQSITKTQKGQIVLVKDPEKPDKLILHRIHDKDENNNLILKGDANNTADKNPINEQNFVGNAILKIPQAGLPYTLYRNKKWAELTILTTLLIGIIYLAGKSPKTSDTPDKKNKNAPKAST